MNALATIDYSLPLSISHIKVAKPAFQILEKKERQSFMVRGWSTGAAAQSKYLRLLESLESLKNTEGALSVYFEYDTFDTSTARYIFKIIRILNTLHRAGKNVKINWICDAEDGEMIETGLDYTSFCEFSFQIRLK